MYVDLRKAGESRYICWQKQFRCCLDEGFENTVSHTEETCRIMEAHLKDWEKTLHSMRWKYPSLNFFTVYQLVHLQKMLFGIFKNPLHCVAELPRQTFTLLECICPDISVEVLKNAIRSSKFEIQFGQEIDDNESWKKVYHPEDRFEDVSNEKIVQLLSELFDEGLPNELSLAAINACGAENFDEIYVWCIDNASDYELVKTLADEMNEIMKKKDSVVTQQIERYTCYALFPF